MFPCTYGFGRIFLKYELSHFVRMNVSYCSKLEGSLRTEYLIRRINKDGLNVLAGYVQFDVKSGSHCGSISSAFSLCLCDVKRWVNPCDVLYAKKTTMTTAPLAQWTAQLAKKPHHLISQSGSCSSLKKGFYSAPVDTGGGMRRRIYQRITSTAMSPLHLCIRWDG